MSQGGSTLAAQSNNIVTGQNSAAGATVQSVMNSGLQAAQKKSKRAQQQRLNNMLQGLMFLPDGRVLIMDSELFKETIEKSIVLDLFDGTSLC